MSIGSRMIVAKMFAGGDVLMLFVEVVVLDNCVDHLFEVIPLASGNSRATSERSSSRSLLNLRLARERRLPIRFAGRFPNRPTTSATGAANVPAAPSWSPWGDVGERVQTDVVVAAAHAVEGIQATDSVVAFENADALVVVGQANPRRQPRHPRADDDGVVHANGGFRIRVGRGAS